MKYINRQNICVTQHNICQHHTRVKDLFKAFKIYSDRAMDFKQHTSESSLLYF